MARTPLRDVPGTISGRIPFVGNSMFAQLVKAHHKGYDVGYLGQLPATAAQKFQDDLRAAGKLYVVYSYDTPIAWGPTNVGGDLYVPAVKYSATTSKHQWIARRTQEV